MRKWYITVETLDGPKTSFFYYSDKNPFKKYQNDSDSLSITVKNIAT